MNHFQAFADQVIKTSPRGILFADAQFRISLINDTGAIRFGRASTDDLMGQRVDQAATCAALRSLVKQAEAKLTAETSTVEHCVSTKPDNSAEPSLTLRCTKVMGDDGQLIGYSCVFWTEQETADQQHMRVMVDNLMRNSQDMIYFKNLKSEFTYCSESLVERAGFCSKGDLIGKSDFDIWDEACANSFYQEEQEIIRTGKPLIGQAGRELRPDGTTTWVLSSKMPLIDERGEIVGTFGISKDITVQKEFELELEKTHRELVSASRYAGMAEVATNVIHNVGNVLNSINVSVSQTDEIAKRLKINNLQRVATLIEDNAKVPGFFSVDEKGKRLPEYLKLISAELQKDKDEIESELQATKRHLEHIKMIVSMQQEYATAGCVVEQVDLAEVLDDAIRMSSGSLQRHQIKLVRDFEPGMAVAIDKHRVLQILVNLIRNAKHAMQATDRNDKTLHVSVATADKGFIAIKISDNGVGISADNLTKLFTHGFTTKSHGHGFGLHSGANAAKELGGSLTAFSDGLGKGATFTLTLPKEEETTPATTTAPILHGDLNQPIDFGNNPVC
jgi:PAS domain S-box-containing protein